MSHWDETVRRLREMHASAAGGDRPRAALLLAMALVDRADGGPVGTAEVVALLDEAAAGGEPPSLVDRCREALAAAAPGPAAMPGPAGIDRVRHWVRAAEERLGTTAADDPARARLVATAAVRPVLDLATGKRWGDEHARILAELDGLTPSDPVTALLVDTDRALLRAMRSVQAGDHADVAEIRGTAEDLEAALARSGDLPPEFAVLVPTMKPIAGMLLVQVVFAESRGQAEFGAPLPAATAATMARARAYLQDVPPGLEDHVRVVGELLDMIESGPGAGRDGGLPPEWSEVGGSDIDLLQVMERAERARASGSDQQVTASIEELRTARSRLAAGHPMHAQLLGGLANLLGYRAGRTQDVEDLADAVDAGVQAVRADREPSAEVAGHLVGVLSVALVLDQRAVPYGDAEAALADALGRVRPADEATFQIGLGTARALRWRETRDAGDRRAARHALDDAERLLGPARTDDRWIGPAWTLLGTNAALAGVLGDSGSAGAAIRMIDRIEGLLGTHPELAARLAGHLAQGPAAALQVTRDGPGVLQALATMRQVLRMSDGVGSASGADRAGTASHVRAVVESLRSGAAPPLDLPALTRIMGSAGSGPMDLPAMMGMLSALDRSSGGPVDVAAMMQAGMGALLDGGSVTDSFTTLLHGPQPPLPPDEESTALLTNRGIAAAETLLGIDRDPARRRLPLDGSGRPGPAALRSAVADLRRALEGGSSSAARRRRVHGLVGLCLAELVWQDVEDAEPLLRDAIVHLERALSAGEHVRPTLERADLYDVLARCQRRARRRGEGDADRTARTALRELRRCVLVEAEAELGLVAAERATPIVARAVDWCLADGRPREALGVAELGRGLVLASVVVSHQIGELLDGSGDADAAAAWRRGDEDGRTAGLTAASASVDGQALLSAPSIDQIAAAAIAVEADAVVYLVPPGPTGGGHALLARADSQVEELPLPGLADRSALAAYVDALSSALDRHDPGRPQPGGFQASVGGPEWARALDDLGRWAYGAVVGPLLGQTRSWRLGREPHLALVPLGELAAVPFAGAWTTGPSGARRYAVEDLVVSYAGSGRLLTQIARRARPKSAGRTVFAVDPTGELHYSRMITKRLAAEHGNAFWFGRRSTGGPATGEVVLAALDDPDAGGASLLQLTTHGRMAPVPGLLTEDGWVSLDDVLARGRDRPADAAGGLVVTTACLTDSATARFDQGVTLAAALLAGGSTGVVGTRWPIDDPTAAAFTYLLHQRLPTHHPAQAVRLAQLDLLRPDERGTHLPPELARLPRARFEHPAGWAAYVHYGA